MNSTKDIIEELGLIKNLIKYVVPESKDQKKETIQGKDAISQNLEEKLKPKKTSFLEEVVEAIQKTKTSPESFSFSKTEKTESKTELKINYHETESEETITIEGEDEEEKKYQFTIQRKKPIPEAKPYNLNISYHLKKDAEEISINYSVREYPKEREKALQDFTSKLDKTLHIMPKSLMGGILGYTYLGENFMARREDLVGETANMVDIHEAIHTDNEYETRVLTDWILSKEPMKYKK